MKNKKSGIKKILVFFITFHIARFLELEQMGSNSVQLLWRNSKENPNSKQSLFLNRLNFSFDYSDIWKSEFCKQSIL